jgi:hypothetical protein
MEPTNSRARWRRILPPFAREPACPIYQHNSTKIKFFSASAVS